MRWLSLEIVFELHMLASTDGRHAASLHWSLRLRASGDSRGEAAAVCMCSAGWCLLYWNGLPGHHHWSLQPASRGSRGQQQQQPLHNILQRDVMHKHAKQQWLCEENVLVMLTKFLT